jgi:hypothetical protein
MSVALPMDKLDASRDQVGESPLWSVAEQALYWVDIEGRQVRRFDWATRRVESWACAERVACLALHAQGGLVAAIDTEPVPADGRTCLKLPFCHWKTKAAAAPFSPSASNFTGPCTVVTATPLCR